MKLFRRIAGWLIVLLLIALAHGAGVLAGFLQWDHAQRVMRLMRPILTCHGADCGFSSTEGRAQLPCDPYREEAVAAAAGEVAVVLAFGQSNAANFGETPFSPIQGVDNFNPFDGKCYRAQDPLLGPDGSSGSPWTRLGHQLVSSGQLKRVLLVPIAVGGSSIKRWTPGGDLHPRIADVKARLDAAGVRVTHIFWHQGESDAYATTGSEYVERFDQLLTTLRERGLDAPVYPAVATRCGAGVRPKAAEIQAAQRSLPERFEGVFPGPDTDQLDRFSHRVDGCHFSDEGLRAHAALWIQAVWAPKRAPSSR
jgi:hypothetical protein